MLCESKVLGAKEVRFCLFSRYNRGQWVIHRNNTVTLSKKRFTAQQIHADLWQQITDFDIFPGSRITETELAEKYQTSRTPVREALKRLEAEGLVSVRPKQGCFVRQVDIELISDYYTVRVALETMAVELACEYMDEASIKALEKRWNPDNYGKEHKAVYDIKKHEEEFHIKIAEGSRNKALVEYLQDVNNRIRPIRLLGFPDDRSVIETYEEHFQICTLIRQRDKQGACKAMAAHIRKSQNIARTVTLSQLEQYRNRR